jgi:hypothetical protein
VAVASGTISRRKELKLPVASLFSSDSSSFTYSDLFQGGLIGLGIVSYQFAFVLVSPGVSEDVLQRLPLTMFLPIVLLAQQSLQLFLMSIFSRQYLDTLTHSPVLIMSGAVLIGILVMSVLVEISLLSDENNVAFSVQTILTVIVSLCYSYSYGVREGVKTADPELTYPLVSIEVLQGTNFENARLYERTDTDYRIVLKDGSNRIIPASNVKQIMGL